MTADNETTPESFEHEPAACEPSSGAGGIACAVISGPAGATASARLDHQGLVKEWLAGNGISARARESKTGDPAFDSAGFIAVAIDLAKLPLSAVLTWPYTQQYCSVVAYPALDADGECSVGVCLLAFELPSVSKKAATYALLQAGLEDRYFGALRAADPLQVYRPAVAGATQVLGGRLTPEAVQELTAFGKEAKAIRRGPGEARRSRVKLDLDTVIKTAVGDELTFGMLPPSVIEDGKQPEPEYYCPMHADTRPSAFVFRDDDGLPVLACLHCWRGFTVRDKSNDYDFGQYDRIVRDLAKAEADSLADAAAPADSGPQFELRRDRYLGDLPLAPGILCVKSPKGSGKTEALVKLIGECKKAKQNVLLVGHRRTLLLSMAQRLGLWCYLVPPEVAYVQRVPKDRAEREAKRNATLPTPADGWTRFSRKVFGPPPDPSEEDQERQEAADEVAREMLGGDMHFGEPSNYYAVSVDSLTVLEPSRHHYDVIVIDEAEQVFAHLVSPTLKDKRREVFRLLAWYLRKAKSVILLDADLGMVTMTSLFAMQLFPETSVRFIVNDYKQAANMLKLYPGKSQLVDRLHEALAAGDKCYLATNSKNKAIELHKALTEALPALRIVVIHADNASTAEMQALLGDIATRFEHDIDLLIATPALGTGIDVTFKDDDGNSRTVVDHVFGLFVGMVTTHFDLDQQLMRVRHPGQVHVWVDPVGQDFETSIDVIKTELLRTAGETRTLIGYDDDGRPILNTDDKLIEIWARVRAMNRGSKNRLAALFQDLREANGWQASLVANEDDASVAGAAALQLGKELRVEERVERLQAAPVLDPASAAKLEKRDRQGLSLTVDERWALERYRIEDFYAEAVSEELISLDADGRTRPAVRNLEIMLAPGEVNRKLDQRQLGDGQGVEGVWVVDRSNRSVKARLLRDVLAAAGVFDAKKGALIDGCQFEQATLGTFAIELWKNAKQFESVFELKPRKDAKHQSVRQLGMVLEKIGLTVTLDHVSDAGGRKVRWYRLDEKRLARLMGILAQQEAARIERSKRKAEAANETADADPSAKAT